jgi:hypothetical protein
MDNRYQNLYNLFKSFRGRYYHLIKFLIDQNAINPEFLERVSKSTKITTNPNTNFKNINEMDVYYKSMVNDLDVMGTGLSIDDFLVELDKKIELAIQVEDYEEAARIRDYIKSKKI